MRGSYLVFGWLMLAAACAPVQHGNVTEKTRLIYGFGQWSDDGIFSVPLPVAVDVWVVPHLSIAPDSCGRALRAGAIDNSSFDFLNQPYDEYVKLKLTQMKIAIDEQAVVELVLHAKVVDIPSSLLSAVVRLNRISERTGFRLALNDPIDAIYQRAISMLLISRLLENAGVVLEPYERRHMAELEAAAHSAPGIWDYMPDDLSAIDFAAWFEGVLAEQGADRAIFHAVRRKATSRLCGSTSYLNIAPVHARVEIGYTWYVPDAQGTEVNPAAKLLMLENAFAFGAERVELKCDARNARSRAAITKLGAVEEGTLRRHMRTSRGVLRDTVYYSILREEWPNVRARLEARLAEFGRFGYRETDPA